MNIEYISVPLELKSLEAGEFEGYGSTFGNVDLGGDVVMKGAFKDSLARYKSEGEWPQMFWMHRPDQIPGMWLDMAEDDKGLWNKGMFLPTTVGNDVKVLMKAKAVKTLSIGYTIESQDDYEYRDAARLLYQVNLWEVSPVSMAMNPKARISAVKARLHSMGKSLPDIKRELEQWFRTKGLSKSEAVTLASRALAPDELFMFGFGAMPNSKENGGDESGEMLDELPRRDAGEAEDETDEAMLLKAALNVGDRVLAGMIRLPAS